MKGRVLVRRERETVRLSIGGEAVVLSFEEAQALGAKLAQEATMAATTALGNLTLLDLAREAAKLYRRRRR